jgi:hypothetical protein
MYTCMYKSQSTLISLINLSNHRAKHYNNHNPLIARISSYSRPNQITLISLTIIMSAGPPFPPRRLSFGLFSVIRAARVLSVIRAARVLSVIRAARVISVIRAARVLSVIRAARVISVIRAARVISVILGTTFSSEKSEREPRPYYF